MLNVDRTVLRRYINGDALPGREILRHFIQGCALSPGTKTELLQAYEITVEGENNFLSRKFIEEMIAINSPIPQASTIHTEMRDALRFKSDVGILNNSFEINQYLSYILGMTDNETCNVYCHFQPDYHYGMQALYNLLSVKNDGLIVKHIFRFYPQNVPNGPLLNLQSLNAVLPLHYGAKMSGTDSYHSYYYYDDRVTINERVLEMFPNAVVTKRHALLFSADRGNGFIFTNNDAIRLLTNEIERVYNNSYPLAQTFTDVFEYNAFYMEKEQLIRDSMVTIKNDPCFLFFFDEEILHAYVNKTVPYRDVLIDLGCKRLDFWRQNVDKAIIICTTVGIQNFTNDGIITDIPPEVANPLPIEYRKKFIGHMIDKIKNIPGFRLFIFRPEILDDIKWKFFSLCDSKELSIKLFDNYYSVIINEKGIVDAFTYYVKYLQAHQELFLSKEEMIDFLGKLIVSL